MAFKKRTKRRLTRAPKFYFHDVGIVNKLAKKGKIQIGILVKLLKTGYTMNSKLILYIRASFLRLLIGK